MLLFSISVLIVAELTFQVFDEGDTVVSLNVNRHRIFVADPLFVKVVVSNKTALSLLISRRVNSSRGTVRFYVSSDGANWSSCNTYLQGRECVIEGQPIQIPSGDSYAIHEVIFRTRENGFSFAEPGEYLLAVEVDTGSRRLRSGSVQITVKQRSGKELAVIDDTLVVPDKMTCAHVLAQCRTDDESLAVLRSLFDRLRTESSLRSFLQYELQLQEILSAESSWPMGGGIGSQNEVDVKKVAKVKKYLADVKDDDNLLAEFFTLRAAYLFKLAGDTKALSEALRDIERQGDLIGYLSPSGILTDDERPKRVDRSFAY